MREQAIAERHATTPPDEEWVGDLIRAAGNAAAHVKDLLAELRQAEGANGQLRARIEKATQDLGALAKIADPCPTCGSRSLMIDAGGHLLCTLPSCKTLSVAGAWRARLRAAEALALAAEDAVNLNGQEYRDKLAAALRGYAASKEESR